jgi:hypothetical protein
VKNRYYIDTISIFAILTNTIRYRYGIDASGIEAEPAGTYDDGDSLDARFQGFPFLRYAVQYWGDHLRGTLEHELKDTAIRFLQDKARSSCATQIEYRLRGISFGICREQRFVEV